MTSNEVYESARSQVKPQKVVSYDPKTDRAVLPCGHWRYSPRKGIAPKKLLCARCIEEKMYAAEQGLHTDAAIVPPVKADSQSDIIPAGEVDHQPRR